MRGRCPARFLDGALLLDHVAATAAGARHQRAQRVRAEVADFAVQFPLYTRRWDITPALAGSRDNAR